MGQAIELSNIYLRRESGGKGLQIIMVKNWKGLWKIKNSSLNNNLLLEIDGLGGRINNFSQHPTFIDFVHQTSIEDF